MQLITSFILVSSSCWENKNLIKKKILNDFEVKVNLIYMPMLHFARRHHPAKFQEATICSYCMKRNMDVADIDLEAITIVQIYHVKANISQQNQLDYMYPS